MIKRKNEKLAKYNKLLGLRNTTHQDAMPKEAMEEAVNFDHGDGFTMERRDGYSRSVTLSSATDMFSPVNSEGLLVVVDGALKSYSDGLVATTIDAAVADTTLHFAEVGDRIYYAGASAAGCVQNRTTYLPLRVPVPVGGITPSGTDWDTKLVVTAYTYKHDATGIEGAAAYSYSAPSGSPPTGFSVVEYQTVDNGDVLYRTDDLYTTLDDEQRQGVGLPDSIVGLAFFDNRLYAATYDATTDTSVVFWSRPWFMHIYHIHKDYFLVKGAVRALHGTDSGVLIGTDQSIYLYNGEQLKQLAAFGVVPGRPFQSDKEGRTAIWTTRGVCLFPDFRAMQMEKVAVAPGTSCTTALVDRRGRKQFIAVTDGNGTAWNAWS
jgi:hypothetical protein